MCFYFSYSDFFLLLIFSNDGWCFANFTLFSEGMGNTWQTFWNRLPSGKTFVSPQSLKPLHSLGVLAAKLEVSGIFFFF